MSSKKYGGRFHKGIASYRVPESVTLSAIEAYYSSLDCPRALTALILFRSGEHEQLSKLEFNPLHYANHVALRDAYAATKFLSKYKGLTLPYDLDEVAFKKFDEFELLCKQTNSRFRNLLLDPKYSGRVVWLHHAVTRKIAKILGDFSAEDLFSMPDWGPGASTLIKRRDASPAKKFRCETGITRDLYSLIPWETLKEAYPLWADQLVDSGFPNFQVGNKVITVPKDATTNRVIAIEPGLNLWFQKAVGDMIGMRLRRYGVDLRYQSRNQELARKGSLTSKLATIDLSSASDSIASSVVEEIIPQRWFLLMDSCRSHYGTQNDSFKKWEKFSSMGNGFTFQLESLIFYAVACCCADYLHVESSDVSAYGDDVVLPTACFELFSEMLDFYGFRLNVKKSHKDSTFRESCGAHFVSGVDVKPIYLKDRVSSVPAVFRLANAIRRQAHRHNSRYGCDARFHSAFELLVHSVPKPYRFRIPNELGDGGFISSLDEATPSRARHGLEGYRVRNVVEVSSTYQDDTNGYLLAALWQLHANVDLDFGFREHIVDILLQRTERYTGERHLRLQAIATFIRPSSQRMARRNAVSLNGRVSFKVADSLCQRWYDLGPWI
ncbi:TPA_asm: RNA-directed RNA polymerase [ssRNA phage Esthiorhiza.2_37]|uniref:RNA-directed RNA polymerase n=2 Tax=Fiersviridae TaxID=2842319 RepID=A0A8S5L2L2_9VIRU|nr:RNA-directed RNA polymerase [ssRNA phage Esthiorhiza.2_37]QDH87121.1 MAG: RNA-dependent RNA polymerase [Leviviridae sp.]DAD51889.1 TPA_asm: RNA-directed RNA polymerase [ssRNA phage Esthiorhiza.2_37]